MAAAEAAGFRMDLLLGKMKEKPRGEREVDLMGSTEANQSASEGTQSTESVVGELEQESAQKAKLDAAQLDDAKS